MKIQRYIRYILAIAFIIYWAFATFEFTSEIVLEREKITRCGKITFKSSYNQYHKHSTSVEFVLVVKYDDTGRKEDVDVSASTWSSYDVGDNICFTSSKNIESGFWNFIHAVLGIIGLVVLTVGTTWFLVLSFRWIFTGVFWSSDDDDD